MDPSSQYQHQNLPSLPYFPSPHDQQQQPYYPYHHHHQYNQPQQQYPYYPPQQQHYTNSYHQNQQSQQEPPPIHPPGVPVPHEHGFGQTHFQNHPNSYYPPQEPQQQQQQLVYSDPGVQGQQWQGNTGEMGLLQLYPQTGQTKHSGAGRSGGRYFRGGGLPFRGRGRGKGRIGNSSIGQPTPVLPPPHMAWCELCRVDCNTPEILENHKNGKKHKKNLKVQEELQAILAQKTQEAAQMTNNASKPETETVSALPETVAVSDPPENGQPKVSEEQGRGLKRKAKSGKGGKVMRTNEGLKKPVEPTKLKEVVPFICELCNVKCESACVFDSHLKGKKHLFNLQRFQEQQATLGQSALQALYPALQALYPALLQALSQQNPNAATSSANGGGLDQQVLQWLQAFLPQAGPGPSVLPQGPEIQGSTSGGGVETESKIEEPTEGVENQKVETESKIEEPTEGVENQKVETESKIEEPTEGAENQVETESKIEELDSKITEEQTK